MTNARRPDGSLDPAADFHDDGGTPDWRARQRQRNREGWAAFGWAGARVVLFFPLLATITVPAGAIAYALATVWTGDGSGLAILIGIAVGLCVAGRLFRDAGGMAFLGQPLRLRVGGAPRNLLEATAGGIFNGLMSIYCAYAVMFYAVLAVVIAAAPGGYFH